jgi:hypothetical protein
MTLIFRLLCLKSSFHWRRNKREFKKTGDTTAVYLHFCPHSHTDCRIQSTNRCKGVIKLQKDLKNITKGLAWCEMNTAIKTITYHLK